MTNLTNDTLSFISSITPYVIAAITIILVFKGVI